MHYNFHSLRYCLDHHTPLFSATATKFTPVALHSIYTVTSCLIT